MGKRTEFLYLSEPDVIEAGVQDHKNAIANAEEVFTLLAKGDYLMGGSSHNNHGIVASLQCRLTWAADLIYADRIGMDQMQLISRRGSLALY